MNRQRQRNHRQDSESDEEMPLEEVEETRVINKSFLKMCEPMATKKSMDVSVSAMIRSFQLNRELKQYEKVLTFNHYGHFIFNAAYIYTLNLDSLEKQVFELLKFLNQSVKSISRNQGEVSASASPSSSSEVVLHGKDAETGRRKRQKKPIFDECTRISLLPDTVEEMLALDAPYTNNLEDYNPPVILLNKAQRVPDLISWAGYLSVDCKGEPLNVSEIPNTVSGMGVHRFWNLITDFNNSLESDAWTLGIDPRHRQQTHGQDLEDDSDVESNLVESEEDNDPNANFQLVEHFVEHGVNVVDVEGHRALVNKFARKNKISNFIRIVNTEGFSENVYRTHLQRELSCGLKRVDENHPVNEKTPAGYECNIFTRSIDFFEDNWDSVAEEDLGSEQPDGPEAENLPEPQTHADIFEHIREPHVDKSKKFIRANQSYVEQMTKKADFDIQKYEENVISKLETTGKEMGILEVSGTSSFEEGAKNFLAMLTLINKGSVKLQSVSDMPGSVFQSYKVKLNHRQNGIGGSSGDVFVKPKPR